MTNTSFQNLNSPSSSLLCLLSPASALADFPDESNPYSVDQMVLKSLMGACQINKIILILSCITPRLPPHLSKVSVSSTFSPGRHKTGRNF